MSRFWSQHVHNLTPYVPGEQPQGRKVIKLNTNECPWGPSPRVLAALRATADERLRLYPDPDACPLKQAAAAANGLQPAQVFAGNGSDEVLAHVFQALLRQPAPLLMPDITYSFYPVYCGLFGIDFQTVALDADFRLRVADYARPCGGIIFANPNAPTGIALPLADIEALLAAHPDVVVVADEAYVDFGGESACALIDRFDNLLVVQTLSKSRALAGLRVGLAFGHADLIAGLERVKNSFNSYPLDMFAINGATAAYEDEAWFRDIRDRVVRGREALAEALTGLGFRVLPSATNFLFARPGAGHEAAALAAALRQQGILVRHFNRPRISDWLRITVGTPEECAALVAALQRLCAPAPV